ncbi:class I adenylate-forming enzyme family protein [Pseudonocardia ailaonensis]
MAERAVPTYPATLWELIEQRSRETPGATMYLDDRSRTLTFGQYRDRCEAVAAGLAVEHGVRPGDRVSWQLPTGLEAMVLLGALARLGAVQNPIIPMLRHADVDAIARQVGPRLFVVADRFRGFDHAAMASELSATHGFDVLTLPWEGHDGRGLALPVGDPDALPPAPAADGVRWIYHSSGTTAEPKGILHTDRSVMSGGTGFTVRWGLGPSDVWPIAFPVSHIGGANNLANQLVCGHVIALFSTFDRERTPRLMAEVGATLLGSASPFFAAYLNAQQASDDRLYPRLRACVNGGAPKSAEMHARVRAELGGKGILGSYGLTEFPIATVASFDDSDELVAHTEGRAVPGVEMRTVDSAGRDVPAGEEGEVLLRGPQAFAGYLGPAPEDVVTPDGFVRTGDLGVIEITGHLRITGRLKDIIIRNAENISALELEQAVASHPGVGDVAVIGLPDVSYGERACAVVVVAEGRVVPTLSELREHCLALGLPAQKVPERLEVVDVLPRSSLGKVQKRDLRSRFSAPAARSTS